MSISGNRSNANRRKTKAGLIAALCVVALIMTGTWAYYNNVDALNRFRGESETGAVLHDDFDQDGEIDTNGDQYFEKKVYVENTGESSLFVRITLEEYMEYLGDPHPTGAERKNEEDDQEGKEGQTNTIPWHIHTYTKNTAGEYVCADCGVEVYHSHYEWLLSGDTYEPQDTNLITRFYPADEPYEHKLATDAEKSAGLAQRYEYDELSGNWKDGWEGANKDGIAEAAEVVAMEEYLSRVEAYETDPQDPDGINEAKWKGWIMDTDGYVYWSQRLEPGATTGLLMSGVVMTTIPYGDAYYYAIDVIMEAADDIDIDSWIDGTVSSTGVIPRKKMTTDAVALIERLRRLDYATDIESKKAGDIVPIGNSEWVILKNDPENGTAVILSKESVERKNYNIGVSTDWQWNTSTIYQYLNGEYYEAMDPALREMVVMVENKTNLRGQAYTNQGVVSEEYVYLLSYTEYLTYKSFIPLLNTYWWLRTPDQKNTAYVYLVGATGEVSQLSAHSQAFAVRPVMTIKYKERQTD